jgi:hypothetical protein
MSTPTLSSPQSLSRPVSRQALLIASVTAAIVIAVTVLVLTVGGTTRSGSHRIVQATPRVGLAAASSDAAHFGNPASATSALSPGMGHR